MDIIKHAVQRLADYIEFNATNRTFGRFFRLEGSGHHDARANARFWTEILAGLSTFATMAYIISVNANMLSLTGGTCSCPGTKTGEDCWADPEYKHCITEIQRDLITATAVISGISTIVFGLLINLPVALAPGMGLNAYFTYQLVGVHGQGNVPYRVALFAVFIEGFVFIFLSLVGLRQYIVKLVPESIKIASGVGIGFFLTEIGLSYNGGIGLITGSSQSTLTIAGCPPQYLNPDTKSCDSHQMRNPKMWIGIVCGGFFAAYLMAYRVKTALIIAIALVSIVSWPRMNEQVTFFPHTAEGDEKFEFFKRVVAFRPISDRTLVVQDWSVGENGRAFALAIITFLYVDLLDCTATLHSMARFCGVVNKDRKDFPRSTLAYCTDAFFISVGSLLGVSPVTVFVESGAGVNQGGKTGLTALTTGVCFLLSIFFAPIFSSIPPWATGCTLILVGCMMVRQVTQINFRYIGDTIPAFVTMALMPLTNSVAYGLIGGIMAYTALNGSIWITIKLSRRRWVPKDMGQGDAFNWKPLPGPDNTTPLFLKPPVWVIHKVSPYIREWFRPAVLRFRKWSNKRNMPSDGKVLEDDNTPTMSTRTQFSTLSSTTGNTVEMRSVV